MNVTGIVRKIDDLGRIVLPKELRKSLNINSGDSFSIILDDDIIILKKHEQLKKQENIIINIINCFQDINKYQIYFIIGNKIINKENKVITQKYSNLILERKIYINESVDQVNIIKDENLHGKVVLLPIVHESDLLGAIAIISKEPIQSMIDISKIIMNIIKTLLN